MEPFQYHLDLSVILLFQLLTQTPQDIACVRRCINRKSLLAVYIALSVCLSVSLPSHTQPVFYSVSTVQCRPIYLFTCNIVCLVPFLVKAKEKHEGRRVTASQTKASDVLLYTILQYIHYIYSWCSSNQS